MCPAPPYAGDILFLSSFFMFNVNRVTLLGNVTMDPDAHTAKTGQAITTIGFATNWRTKNAKGEYVSEPEYHKLVCFGPLGEFSAKSVKKGTPLYIEGRIHTSHYKTKEGKDASRPEVIVDRLVLLSSKKGEVAAEAVAA